MAKIIFVDDETNLLQGLQRMLRKKKDEWDMTFLESGIEALEKIKAQHYDVIVTDYKMPDIDGLQLLEEAKKVDESIKRVLLTGQSEEEIFNRAKDIVHIYVSKPCDSEKLISEIEKLLK